jgi:hypothetical protein
LLAKKLCSIIAQKESLMFRVLLLATLAFLYVNYVHSLSLQVDDQLQSIRTVYNDPLGWADRHQPSFDKLSAR